MKVNVEAPQFVPDVKLIDFIPKKLSKLEQFYDKIIHADVFLKLEPGNKPANKVIEVLLSVPGDKCIVKKNAKSFEEGIDAFVQSLERVLVKRKEKIRSHV
jgi:putative sigma-54 modulation protein